jgi:hypothetical protein
MACDCASARRLSGPGSGNLVKLHTEAIRQPLSWCGVVPVGTPITASTWDVSPVTTVPLAISDEALESDDRETSAVFTGGEPNQLYQVTNIITAGDQAFAFVLWVYIRGSGLPSVYVPCGTAPSSELNSSQVLNVSGVAGVTETAALNALAALVAAVVSGQLTPLVVLATTGATAIPFNQSRKINLTLGVNTTLVITWPTVPQVVVLRIYTGGFTPTFPATVKFPSNVVPSWSAAGKWDELSIDWDGTTGTASYGLNYGP